MASRMCFFFICLCCVLTVSRREQEAGPGCKAGEEEGETQEEKGGAKEEAGGRRGTENEGGVL